jgi:hypothetical protein
MITFYCACPNPQGIYNGKWGNNIIYKLKEKKQSKMLFELTHGQNIMHYYLISKVWRYLTKTESNQFLLLQWYPSCHSCYKAGDKSWMKKDSIVITTNVIYQWSCFSICDKQLDYILQSLKGQNTYIGLFIRKQISTY